MPFSDPIDLTEMRTAFANVSPTTDAKRLGQKDHDGPLRLASLVAGADELARSVAWVQQDDQELRTLLLRVTDTVAGRTVVATVTVDNGDTTFLVDNTVSATLTTINGTTEARADFRTVTGRRMRLLKGVRYRLSIENQTAATTVGGPLEASVQTRSVRRGGAGGPVLVPHLFRNLGNFDVDKINDNLLQAADDIEDSLDQRFTYSRAFVDLSGIADTDAAVLRQVPVRRPAAANGVEIVSVEFVGTDVDAGATWTASVVGLASWPTIDFDGAGANIEVYASSDVPFRVGSNVADVVVQVDASTAAGNKINAGYLVVHFRCDRGNQGADVTPYKPTLFNAKTANDAATLQAQIDAIAAAVARDTAADKDLRVECFVARGLVAGTSVSWNLQGGARRKLAFVAYNVGQTAGGARKVSFQVDATLTNIVGPGAGVRSEATTALAGSAGVDPMNVASDTVVTITALNADCPLAILWVFWS